MYLTACPPTTTHVAGAITPGGAAVTATKGTGSYTLDNGIEHIVITCASGTIKTWTYKERTYSLEETPAGKSTGSLKQATARAL